MNVDAAAVASMKGSGNIQKQGTQKVERPVENCPCEKKPYAVVVIDRLGGVYSPPLIELCMACCALDIISVASFTSVSVSALAASFVRCLT